MREIQLGEAFVVPYAEEGSVRANLAADLREADRDEGEPAHDRELAPPEVFAVIRLSLPNEWFGSQGGGAKYLLQVDFDAAGLYENGPVTLIPFFECMTAGAPGRKGGRREDSDAKKNIYVDTCV